ncbi:MAG: phytochelatin synthase family protein [bacterium]|nr:phytochelatin synthase family protein [bacterium]
MTAVTRVALSFLLLCLQFPSALALDSAPLKAGADLVPFASEEGLARFSRSSAKTDFPELANQFEAQSNTAFCGPTSAAIVLNAILNHKAGLPRDRSRLRAEDLRFLPEHADLSVPRFTQDNVILKGAKTRAQVLGEPVLVNGKQIKDFGYQLRQLDQMLRANGLATRLVIVDDSKTLAAVRRDIAENLKHPSNYVIVGYKRSAVGQQGGGHFSPVGAYDEASDSFLILDVNPASAGWVWMSASTLVNGMRTFDTIENRGYILIEAPESKGSE